MKQEEIMGVEKRESEATKQANERAAKWQGLSFAQQLASLAGRRGNSARQKARIEGKMKATKPQEVVSVDPAAIQAEKDARKAKQLKKEEHDKGK